MGPLRIPRTADAAVTLLGELGALATSTEWRRAAVVASLVGPAVGVGPGRGKTGVPPSFPFTVKGLSEQRIVGLRDEHTIRRYRDAWFEAGRSAPRLGETVSLDGLPEWPPDSKTDDTAPGAQKVKDITYNKKALARAIETDPATAEAAAGALAATPQGRLAAWNAIDRATPNKGVEHRPPREVTQSKLLLAIHRATTAANDLVTEMRTHGERLSEPEAQALLNTARRLRAAADFIEAMATGQTLDEELIALLNEGN